MALQQVLDNIKARSAWVKVCTYALDSLCYCAEVYCTALYGRPATMVGEQSMTTYMVPAVAKCIIRIRMTSHVDFCRVGIKSSEGNSHSPKLFMCGSVGCWQEAFLQREIWGCA